MSQITLRITKGSALTQSEMDSNLRNLINSSSVDVTTGQLSLFTSESSGAEKQIDVRPTWIGYSGSSTSIGSFGILFNPAKIIIKTNEVCHHTSNPIIVGIAAV